MTPYPVYRDGGAYGVCKVNWDPVASGFFIQTKFVGGCPGGYKSWQDGNCYWPMEDPMQDATAGANQGADCSADQDAGDLGTPATQLSCGNPIQPATGNKYQYELDYAGAGANRLRVERHYNSLSGNWTFNGLAALAPITDKGTVLLQLKRDNGRIASFGEGGGKDLTALKYTLSQNPAGWTLATPANGTEQYDGNGRLLKRTSRDGYALTYAYDGAGRLATVTDDDGRRLAYTYDGQNRVTVITLPGNTQLGYGYDAVGRLTSVSYPDGRSRQYRYEDSRFPMALTGLIDEANVRFATWAYDDKGRAVSSEHAGGLEKVGVVYEYKHAGSYTDAAGLVTRFTHQAVKGRVLIDTVIESCSGCTESSYSMRFDGVGNPYLYTDRSGLVTQYVYDPTRLFETRRVEASGTPDARIVDTQWHATLRLPTRITEPGRRSDFVYDAAGNLTQQTTTNLADNSVRTWQYGYDSRNRLTSATDPAGGVTRYSYGAQGNLATVTDAAGLVTQYIAYDADGRLLNLTQPDGVLVTLAYDLRGRLTSRSVGALQTRYSYTPTGLLASVVLPDRTVNYDYDDAHRLIAIRDSLGNRIAYTLDAMGRRLAETIEDSSNTLVALAAQIETDRQVQTLPQTPKAS